MTPERTDTMIDDDTFAYEGDGGFTQCISGFGRNAIETIGDDLDQHMAGGEEHTAARERLKWHVEELVRWCRHFNCKAQRLEREVARQRAVIEKAHALAARPESGAGREE